MPAYAELQVTSNFSFLRGASHPDELVATARALGHAAIGIADRNSLAGIVRMHVAAKEAGLQLVVGCRLDLTDGWSVLVYPTDKAAYARLCRLLSLGKGRAGKGKCALGFADLAEWGDGLIVVALATGRKPPPLKLLRDRFGDAAYLAISRRFRPDDALRIAGLVASGEAAGVPAVVTNDVLYHVAGRRILQDVVTCIREKVTIDHAGFRRERFADRFLKSPAEMARLFDAYPEAVARTLEIASRCRFSLDELRYQYPEEANISGLSPQQGLERLTWEGAAWRYPDGVPEPVAAQLRHELSLIGQLGYAPYFLTVQQIVGFAKSEGILCQGRGSAANSAVCYCLGVTSIDPAHSTLLFERFVSPERKEPPDIDVDFEHERREDVIQWIYKTYGRDRAALAATLIRYRTRGAVGEVGKVMGFTADTTNALSRLVWGWSVDGISDELVREAGLDPTDRRVKLTIELSRALIGFPRHLSQHPGGFVLTRGRLDELVPVEPAAMADRQVIEWDKDDLDAMRMMKVDVLGLGMLGCLNRCFNLLHHHKGLSYGLATIPQDDEATYDMLCRADSLGVFQVESRAQMNMLPRLRPRKYYDLVIEVAIVRPGPIQGDMVHPYIRRRQGIEQVSYPSDELERVLSRTLGVPLFQEQAMQIAIVAAGFTPAKADQLRRAMATFKHTGTIHKFATDMIEGMVERGYERDFATRCFKQIEGFGTYGFPESHAASFALLVYVSSWLKCHHPDVFCCALLNAQPMGFYAPAQIVRDAREHGVTVLPVDVNRSRWDCTLEPTRTDRLAVRLGLRMVKGLAERDAARIVVARGDAARDGSYDTIEALWRRAGVPVAALRRLAEADALGSLSAKPSSLMGEGLGGGDAAPGPGPSDGRTHPPASPPPPGLPHQGGGDFNEARRPTHGNLTRRQALWTIEALSDISLPLFAAADERDATIRAERVEEPVALPVMGDAQEVAEDYLTLGLSLRRHPLAFLRDDLAAGGMVPLDRLASARDGQRIRLGGLVLVRQRPGSAKGVMFITIEDETGHANLVVWPDVFERLRRTILSAGMLGVKGRVQREGQIIHVVVETLTDLTGWLRRLQAEGTDLRLPAGRGDEARSGGGPDPRDAGSRHHSKSRPRDIYCPDLPIRPDIKVKTRDFR